MSLRFKLFSLSLIACLCTWAYNITGKVTDSAGEPMGEATVRLLSAKDSTYVKGLASNMAGKFTLTDIKNGKYILEVSYIGYKKSYVDVNLRGKNVTLSPIVMNESSILLADAIVTAIKTPIKVSEDTVEYNADSYKTRPNAVIEDLLKRLPGVEVDSEGKITHNGKEITKILVEGKEFFSDDPKVASKNLPVNMVQKLQVVERKSDLARSTGVDDGEEETVINLTVKPGMKNGWFGTVEAGYGTDSRYQETFNINRFWNDNQLTFIGSANNTNDLGFTDGNGNRFRRFGGNRGINTSQSFGVNFNVGNKEILRVGGNVMYSHSKRVNRNRSERIFNFEDSFPTQSSHTNSNDRGHNIRADFRMKWEPDSFNRFEFRPRMSYNINDSDTDSESLNRAGNSRRDSVTRSINTGDSHGKSFEFGGELVYRHNFKQKKGRSFSVQMRYNLSNIREHENSYSWNRFFLLDSINLYDQYLENHTWSNTMGGRLTWTEPIGDAKNGNFLTLAYRINYRWNNADKDVYDHPVDYYNPMNPVIDYESLEFNDSLSNRFRNDNFTQDIRLGYQKVTKNFNFNGGLSLVPTMSKSDNLLNDNKSIPERWVWNYAPFIRARYRMTKQRSLALNYNGRSSQPSMSQLQPVADYSDPLRVVVGNPNLDPSFSHNINFRFQDFNPTAQRALMFMADFSVVQNSIVSKTTYNQETAGQITTYENVNGVWNGRLMNMISLPFKRRTWTFNNHIFANYNQRVGFNNGSRNVSKSIMLAESFGIAFRPDNLELEIRPNYRLQRNTNSVQAAGSSTIHNYGGMFNGTYYTPIGIVLATDLSYTASSGYSSGYDTKTWMWNASISYQFLKGKEATVSVRAYDLLRQQSNISRNITANYTEDAEYNSLTRYFMFSFTYKFNTFGKGNQPSNRYGGGRGHGGPGGPPRGMRP